MRATPLGPDSTHLRTSVVRAFPLWQNGSVAVEGAIAVFILVGALAGLMAIVQESYATDQMGRAARAVARAVALDAQADHCAAIRRELGLAADFDCESEWAITINRGVSPSSLSTLMAGKAQDEKAKGELILVRIGWNPEAPEDDTEAETVSESDADGENPGDAEADLTPVAVVAMAVARSEPNAD